MRCGDKAMKNCLTGLNVSKQVMDKLRSFGIMQQELARELLEAKPLGICKITTYVGPKFDFKNLDITRDVGKDTIRTVTILTKEDLKEMWS